MSNVPAKKEEAALPAKRGMSGWARLVIVLCGLTYVGGVFECVEYVMHPRGPEYILAALYALMILIIGTLAIIGLVSGSVFLVQWTHEGFVEDRNAKIKTSETEHARGLVSEAPNEIGALSKPEEK